MKMKIMVLLLCSFVLLSLACNKDKYTTEPQVKFKSITPKEVNRIDKILTFTSTFYDDEGDIDSIYLVAKWYNGNTATVRDTLVNSYAATTAPVNARTGDISMVAEYLTQTTGNKVFPSFWTPDRDTVATLGIVLKDKAGHRSNYAESDKFVLKKP